MTGAPALRADAVIFDKDGTLFDFRATWDAWACGAIEDLSEGDGAARTRLAAALGFDLDAGQFRADSPVIAGTHLEAAELAASALPDRSVASVEAYLLRAALAAPLAPAVPLEPLADRLTGAGLRLAVMTNDSEAAAREHLSAAGVLHRFAPVVGFDSGAGQKPDPDPLRHIAERLGLPPARVVMVGDSAHDLLAARAAGMSAVGVLTGVATRGDLAPLADAVLADIGALPGWLGLGAAAPAG